MLISVISLSPHLFSFCFYSWLYILNVSSITDNGLNIFGMAVYIFLNLFWKIRPLFWQILITYLISRASFSLCSYTEKMCWGHGCRFWSLLYVVWMLSFIRYSSLRKVLKQSRTFSWVWSSLAGFSVITLKKFRARNHNHVPLCIQTVSVPR